MRLIILAMLSSASLAAFSTSAVQARPTSGATPVQRVRAPLPQEPTAAGVNSRDPAEAAPGGAAPAGRALPRGSRLNLVV